MIQFCRHGLHQIWHPEACDEILDTYNSLMCFNLLPMFLSALYMGVTAMSFNSSDYSVALTDIITMRW